MMKIFYGGLLILGVVLGVGFVWNFIWSRSQVNVGALTAQAMVTARFEQVRPNDPVFTIVKTAQSREDRVFKETVVTANDDYAVKLYWGGHYRRLYVTAPQGINVYETSHLTGKVSHVKQGAAVAVVRVVTHGEVTRFRLANGTYITGNKQFVSPTKPRAKQVRAKTAVRRYEDVNLTNVVQAYQKGAGIDVTGWDHASGDSRKHRPGRHQQGNYVGPIFQG